MSARPVHAVAPPAAARTAAWAIALTLTAIAACGELADSTNDAVGDGTGAGGDDGTVANDSAHTDAADATAGPGTVEARDLGTFTTGQDGKSGTIDFDLPAGVTALTLTLKGPPDVELQIAALERGSAVALVPPAWIGISADPGVCLGPCANRVLAQPERAAFLFPNTPLVALEAGPQRLRLFAFRRIKSGVSPVVAKVAVGLHLRYGPLHLGNDLAVNLIYTGAHGLTRDAAASDADFQAALAEARKRLAVAGIVLNPVRHYEVDGKLGFIVTREGSDGDLAALFRAGEGLPAGVNVFFVDSIYATSGGGGPPGLDLMLGVAGGIPGEPDAAGTSRAGIAIAGERDDPVRLGRAIAHEIGHYLGLFHTTEAPDGDGDAIADPLPDTPQPAGDNLMHWSVSAQSIALSHEQSQVLRRSPMLRPMRRP